MGDSQNQNKIPIYSIYCLLKGDSMLNVFAAVGAVWECMGERDLSLIHSDRGVF